MLAFLAEVKVWAGGALVANADDLFLAVVADGRVHHQLRFRGCGALHKDEEILVGRRESLLQLYVRTEHNAIAICVLPDVRRLKTMMKI